jgi:hypothetical protein
MGYVQKLTFVTILFFSSGTLAIWQVAVNHAGFFGIWSLGAIYKWPDRFSLEFGLGRYQIDGRNFWQSNIAYRYAIWKFNYEQIVWTPLQPGLFLVASLDREKYFVESSPRYPYPNYYDQTAVRGGLELGTKLAWKNSPTTLVVYLRMIDGAILALYNTSKNEFQYYLASGVSLQYDF